MIRNSRVALLTFVLLCGAVSPQGAATLTLGTWNIENLGFRDPRRTDADYAQIAEFIRETGADVLAVQEIGGPEPLGRLVAQLPGWKFVLGESGGFRGEPGRISVGFLWNDARVELLVAEDLRGVPTEVDGVPIFHRQPVTAAFRTRDRGLDFRAVVVHLKASRGSLNERKRMLEIAVLREILTALGKVSSEDQDVVVLGDFNHAPGTPEHAAFTAGDLVAYASARSERPTIVHFDDPIDHFAVSRGLREELRPESRKVHDRIASADKERWRAHYSDHVPVTIQLDAGRDRDPEARFSALKEFGGVALGAVAPTARPTESAALPSFAIGSRIQLTTAHGGSFEGTLSSPLGDWIQLRRDDGKLFAIPATSVHFIQLVR